MMSNKEDLVYVDCFYYGFYIKKSELSKYNIKSEQLVQETKNIYIKLNITNSSNTLNLSRVLEQLNSCNLQ